MKMPSLSVAIIELYVYIVHESRNDWWYDIRKRNAIVIALMIIFFCNFVAKQYNLEIKICIFNMDFGTKIPDSIYTEIISIWCYGKNMNIFSSSFQCNPFSNRFLSTFNVSYY